MCERIVDRAKAKEKSTRGESDVAQLKTLVREGEGNGRGGCKREIEEERRDQRSVRQPGLTSVTTTCSMTVSFDDCNKCGPHCATTASHIHRQFRLSSLSFSFRCQPYYSNNSLHSLQFAFVRALRVYSAAPFSLFLSRPLFPVHHLLPLLALPLLSLRGSSTSGQMIFPLVDGD